jgi:hypothetical protein
VARHLDSAWVFALAIQIPARRSNSEVETSGAVDRETIGATLPARLDSPGASRTVVGLSQARIIGPAILMPCVAGIPSGNVDHILVVLLADIFDKIGVGQERDMAVQCEWPGEASDHRRPWSRMLLNS